jgi:DHA2 family multidrug resistance protein
LALKVAADKPVVSPHALIGIAAVSLAAVNSSLGSGLLGSGIADLRGVWGLGIDDAAYIPTAFSAAQMFMGSLSVMLAARFGHRNILLTAGVIYILVSLFLPFAPHKVPILFFTVLAGLSSGTFYPLCLSFISRNLPVALVPFGIAAYNFDLLVTNHIVQSMEGFFIDHAGWQWIFWSQAILALPMLVCVRIGIPQTPKDQLLPRFRYNGILYFSAALTLFYIALDQGERLDWFNNGLINGLCISGTLLLVATVISRLRDPNPYLDFSYVWTRNVLLLGLILMLFRVMLLRIGFLIPVFLERLHQYRSTDIGWLFLLSVVPFVIALPTIAHFLRKIHVRPALIAGFVILALCNFHDAHALSTWTRLDFIPAQMVGVFGICLIAMGTMCGVVFQGRLSGAYRVREGAYAQGAFFQAVRIFGSQASTSGMKRFVIVREHFWQTKLVSTLSSGTLGDADSAKLATALAPQSAGPGLAAGVAQGLIDKRVPTESFTLATDDGFMLLAWISVIALVAVALMKHIPLPRELPAADATPKPPPDPTIVPSPKSSPKPSPEPSPQPSPEPSPQPSSTTDKVD